MTDDHESINQAIRQWAGAHVPTMTDQGEGEVAAADRALEEATASGDETLINFAEWQMSEAVERSRAARASGVRGQQAAPDFGAPTRRRTSSLLVSIWLMCAGCCDSG